MCCDMLGVVGSSLKMVKFEPTTHRNTVAKRTLHVAPNNVLRHVAIVWPALKKTLLLQAGIELICEFPKQCLIITKTCL